jgi:predicted RND superfamily exporter protein
MHKTIPRLHTDFLVDHRKVIVFLLGLITVFLAAAVPNMSLDVTLKAGLNTNTEAFRRYQDFLATYGTEDYILVAVKSGEPPDKETALLTALQTMTERLEHTPHILEVISLTNIKVFGKKNGLFGSYPIVEATQQGLRFPDRLALDTLRQALPILELLISRDLSTVGLIIGVDQTISYDVPVVDKLLQSIDDIVKNALPANCEYRIIGGPVIRQAIQRYNVQTAVTFGLLCSLVCTIVAFYIFKSLRVTLITGFVVGLCVLWIVGIMAILKVQLNSTTALSFGLVLISSVEPVIHLVVHYNDSLRDGLDPVGAAKHALKTGAGPCLVTSFTTSLGFSSLMVASFPMVQQLGLILSLGPLIAFILAVSLTPAFLIAMKPPPPPVFAAMSSDLVSWSFSAVRRFVFSHSRWCALAIMGLIGVMLLGAPLIHSDPQLLRMLTDSTKEIKDLRFVEKNLSPVSSVELIVAGEENDFKKSEMWQKIDEIDQALRKIKDVSSIDSILPLMKYLYAVASPTDTAPGDLFADPARIPQLLVLTSLSLDGQKMLRRFLDDKCSKVRLTIRIRNSPETPIGDTIENIRSTAARVMGNKAKVYVTGDLAVFEAQASDIVESQASSLILAVFYMSMLLTIQFRSISLGIVSLLPQVLPQAIIFGIMGWFRIPLDSVTVFAAAVSIGLTVDNTVHLLTQLKRELRAEGAATNIRDSLSRAYDVTARAMISNHTVIFFGFIMLLISPYRPVIYVGILGSAAILFSLIGDLVFMPAVILSTGWIRRLMAKEMLKKPASKE